MKHLAIFDWNGTLFDDLEANLLGAGAVFQALGRAPLNAEQFQSTFTFPILHFYNANGISADEYLKNHDRLARIFLEVYENAALECKLRPQATELLQWLVDNAVECMLLTNHLRENVEQQLAKFHIRHFFSLVSCNEEYDATFVQKMNKHDRLKAILEKPEFKPEEAFIIGDSLEEPEIARRLGLTSISITGGSLSNERLTSCETDYVVNDFSQIFPLIGKMWQLDYQKAS